MSQRERVLAALRRGPVCQLDFDAGHVVDGGKPIRRVAARIHELRNAGFRIVDGPPRNGMAVYRLDGAPDAPGFPSPRSGVPVEPTTHLFDPRDGRRALSPYDRDAA